jgi:hypothetical protein
LAISLNKHPTTMKKIAVIILIVFFPFLTMAQLTLELTGSVNKKFSFQLGNTSLTIAEGTSVTLRNCFDFI